MSSHRQFSELTRQTKQLMVCLSKGRNKSASTDPFSELRIAKVLAAIHETPNHPWVLETLPKVAGMARAAFTALFSECSGTTALAHIKWWRVEIARDELADLLVPIIEITELLGYNLEASFGRVVKKML